MSSKLRLYSRYTSLIYLVIGTMLSATAGAVFYTPARITGGGATGIGTIFYYLFGLDQGNVMLCVNIPLILFGMKVFGWKYGIRTLIGSVMLSVWTTIIGTATNYQGFLDYSDNVNVLLSALFGGVLMGTGIGLTMKSGSNTGGTDIISQVVSHYFPLVWWDIPWTAADDVRNHRHVSVVPAYELRPAWLRHKSRKSCIHTFR